MIKLPDTPLKVITAKSVDVQESRVIVVDQNDRRAAYQTPYLKKVIPTFSDAAKSLPDDKVTELKTLIQLTIQQFPESRQLLQPELAKFSAVIEERKAALAALAAGQQKVGDDFVSVPFDEKQAYKYSELKARIDEGEEIKSKYPQLAGKVDAYLAPWQQRVSYLKEGRRIFEGEWHTPKEIQDTLNTRKNSKIQGFFEHYAGIPFSAVVLPQMSMLLCLVFIGATLLVTAYMLMYVANSHGGNLTISGLIMLILGLIVMALYAYYGFKIFSGPSKLQDYAGPLTLKEEQLTSVETVKRMVFLSAEGNSSWRENSDLEVTLTPSEINAALQKIVRLQRPAQGEILDLYREAMRLSIKPEYIELQDQDDCLGKTLLFRYQIQYKCEGDVFSFYDCKVYLGGAQLPTQLGNLLWRNLYDQIVDSLQKSGIARIYRIQKVGDGKISLMLQVPGH